jgi:heme/copper-type cytochrome/quinol oxidase subunit 3
MANTPWPPGGPPELKLAVPNTIILLVSSGTMWWAESGIRVGAQFRLRIGMLVTLILGIIFLVIQGIEYSHKPFALQSNAYSSLFYTITGFHGAHVTAGLLILLVAFFRSLRGDFTKDKHFHVTAGEMYWHFVDVVWIFVVTLLYFLQ